MQYDFSAIESRWQAYWAQHQTFKSPNPGGRGFDPGQPKYYVLDMFPYPSGVGLHVGHPLGYIATDIVARYKRMKGFNVLHPMGYDAFGLPAEQFAVEHGVHPRITTEQNIANMERQLKRLGLSYDWDRGLATTDPGYYRWTQWIFLQLYNAWANPATGKARPIAQLEQLLNSGACNVGLDNELVPAPADGDMEALGGAPIGVRKWHEIPPAEKAAILDQHRLAYLAEVPVNWCPALGTVLANEEVTNEGRSERGNHPVYKRPLKQWMLGITELAERLLSDLDLVDWPEPIKIMQRNWIGKSEGAQVDFALAAHARDPGSLENEDDGTAQPGDDTTGEIITVFTTRPDTLFGATYMVLAPEHALVDVITTPAQRAAVDAYRAEASRKADVDRQADTKTKTGVFTGAYAINPVNDQKIPIWIADYVMMGYGTGAIMAVPAHDERDFAFAKQFDLPIRIVVEPINAAAPVGEALTDPGRSVNSANDEISLNGLPTAEAKKKITAWLESNGMGIATVRYKLRDWLFSRQRYWGEPFPILHAPDGRVVALEESDLPVALPELADFSPAASDDPNAPPQPPLSRAPDSWKYVEKNGVRFTREFNTMPQWAGSCWYYLRFLDPRNENQFVGKDAEKYWMLSRKKAPGQEVAGKHALESSHEEDSSNQKSEIRNQKFFHAGGVDLYVGGAEHAVLHLLYARFWHKVLFDLGHVSTPEPFGRLYNQGYIQAHAYTDARGVYVPAEEVEEKAGQFYFRGEPVRQEFGKMGKSLKNAVAPDDICNQYGCDTLRLYEMYLGPLDQSKVWNTRDIIGIHRFLQRLWRNFVAEDGGLKVVDVTPDENLARLLHKTIKRVTEDMDRLSFNTATAALIELNNELVAMPAIPRQVAEAMTLLLAPMAPHIAEELWSKLGHAESLARHDWPTYDPALLVEDTVEYPVQVNGKLRGKVTVPAGADDKAVEAAAIADEKVAAAMAGKTIRKVIVVKGKLVNLVVG